MAALVGGGVDYTLVAGVAAVRAIAQNAPMTIISGMQPYMDYTLLGAKGITGVNDLKGKVVGVTGPGGIAEFATVEGLAKKGLVRDRDYKILYGVGNSPARAQALETGKIQASPFSFLERLELERKGYPTLFDIGSVMPGFPFVVIVTSKQKIETDPEGIVSMLRAIKRGLDFLAGNHEKVAAVVIKKNQLRRPGHGAQSHRAVCRGLFGGDHQGRHRSVDRRHAHRSGSEKARRIGKILYPAISHQSSRPKPLKGTSWQKHRTESSARRLPPHAAHVERRDQSTGYQFALAPRRDRRRLHAAGLRRIRHRRDVSVMVRHGAQPQRAGRSPCRSFRCACRSIHIFFARRPPASNARRT